MEKDKNKSVTVIYKSPLGQLINLAVFVFAIMTSWFYNHSFWWAVFHGIFSWLYLIYSLIIGNFANGKFMEIIHYYF